MAVKNAVAKNWALTPIFGRYYSDGVGPSGPPDLSLLPAIVGAAPQFLTAAQITSINISATAVGGTFTDPISSVPITRVTNASSPIANTGAFFAYVEGGPWVSGEWGGTKHTIYVTLATPSAVGYLVDYDRDTKALSNWRAVAFGVDQRICFSADPTTPQICYYITNASPGVLNRYDTATDSLANTGNFPHTFTASTTPLWLQMDKDDNMFVCMDQGGTTVRSWSADSNTALNRVFAGLDEPHLERNGQYVAVIVAPNAYCWNLATDAVSNVSTQTMFHVGHLRGRWISPYGDDAAPSNDYQFTPKGTGVAFNPDNAITGAMASYSIHWSGHWIQSVTTDQQYAAAFTFGHGVSLNLGEAHEDHDNTILCNYNTSLGHDSIIYKRMDGGDNRYLCTMFNDFLNSGDYYASMGGLSPDGKVAVFGSNMKTAGGRTDIFVANVPLAAS